MGEAENGHSQDDFDVQITDLPGAEAGEMACSGALENAAMPQLEIMPRFTASQRRLRLSALVIAMALALLVIIGSNDPAWNAVALSLFGPTPLPIAAFEGGANLYFVSVDQPWGKLYLDGHLLAHIPLMGDELPLQLGRGHHQFTWRASPFPPQRCTISVPQFYSDTCRFAWLDMGAGTGIRLVSFHDTLVQLLPAQKAALVRQIQARLDALQASEIVRPGELYARVAPGSIQKSAARQPMRATLHYLLVTGSSTRLCIMINQCQVDGEECIALCTVPSRQALFWEAGAVVQTVWDYRALDGHAIGTDQPDTIDSAAGFDHLVTLSIAWDGADWHVSLELKNPIESYVTNLGCASALDDITASAALVGQWRLAAAPVAAMGCLAAASVEESDGGLSSPSHPVAAYCLHRFGVLLAANDVAHRLWPFMPLADSYGRALAAQLARMPGWTFSVPN